MNATIHNFNNAEKRTISAEGRIVPALSLITTFHSQTIAEFNLQMQQNSD